MTSRIWSNILETYVGEVQEDGRVWSDHLKSFVGEVQESGRVWSNQSKTYVGVVQEDGRVWSDESKNFVGEIQDSGKIWSTISKSYVGEVRPPDIPHGGAALLLLLPIRRRPERKTTTEVDDGETNWVLVILGLVLSIFGLIVFFLFENRYARAVLSFFLTSSILSAVFAVLASSGLHFAVAAIITAAVSAPLYRLCFSMLRWRAKEGPRVNAWTVSGIMAALTLAGYLAAGFLLPTFVSDAVAAFQDGVRTKPEKVSAGDGNPSGDASVGSGPSQGSPTPSEASTSDSGWSELVPQPTYIVWPAFPETWNHSSSGLPTDGRVTLSFIIDPTGSVKDVVFVSYQTSAMRLAPGGPSPDEIRREWTERSLRALTRWRFAPQRRGMEVVERKTAIDFYFDGAAREVTASIAGTRLNGPVQGTNVGDRPLEGASGPFASADDALQLMPQVIASVNLARLAERQARAKAAEARLAKARAQQAAALGREAAQKAEAHQAGYDTVRGYGGGKDFRYAGEVVNGLPKGYGVRVWTDGARDEGQFDGINRSGSGVSTMQSGYRYEGEFAGDMRSGLGVETWPDGSRYQGEHRNGEKVGLGVDIGGSSSPYAEYAGHWSGDQWNGYGIMVLRNGQRWEGVFVDVFFTGLGVKLDAQGGVVEQGMFEAGALRAAAGR